MTQSILSILFMSLVLVHLFFFLVILLMVQKSGDHQLRLVVEIPLFTVRVLAPSQVVGCLGFLVDR